MEETDKREIPSSSPIVTPIKMIKRQKLVDANDLPQDLFGVCPDSPESIHSSDQCSYSSYFERKAREKNQESISTPSTVSSYVTAPSQPPESPKVIPSSQEEFQGTPIPIKHFTTAPENKVAFSDSDDEEERKQDTETLNYIRKYCTESALASLPAP